MQNVGNANQSKQSAFKDPGSNLANSSFLLQVGPCHLFTSACPLYVSLQNFCMINVLLSRKKNSVVLTLYILKSEDSK